MSSLTITDMKFIKHKFLLVVAGLMICLPSCDLQDVNVNPNKATDAPLNVLLPTTQGNLVWAVNDFAAQSTSTLVQYLSGTLNVQQNVTEYKYLPVDFQTTWNNHFYAGTMKDLKTIIEKSTQNGALHYRGVAKIQMAIALAYLVDLWGDVPYSTALRPEVPKPTYDADEDLYLEVFKLLNEGIDDLSDANNSSTSPSTSDRFYPEANEGAWRSNSRPKWIKVANAIKARCHNHLSKVNPTKSAQDALASIAAGTFTNNGEEMKVSFGSTSDTSGPWYGLFLGSFGLNNIGISQGFINMLNDRVAPGVDDPRLRYFVTDDGAAPDADGNYVGTPYGASLTNGTSRLGPYVNTASAPTNMITYAEVKFIEAEANFRLNQYQPAADALNAAIKASILRVTGASNPAYEAKFASETAATIQVDGLQKIFTEKYIAMFLQTEAWADWRRSIPAGAAPTTSGIPTLVPAAKNGTNGVFPRRFLYPSSEINNNQENIKITSLTERVFWDL
jgi:hypothetical protein